MKNKSTIFYLLTSLKIKFLLLFLVLNFFSLKAQVSSYIFSESSNVTYTPVTGTNIFTPAWDDNTPQRVTIPFTFNFNNAGYTSLVVSPNGYVTFGTTFPDSSVGAGDAEIPISTIVGFDGSVSALGMDLWSNGNTNGGGNISYATLGSAPNRTFVVQYANAYRYNYGGTWNFQIRLSETTNIIRVAYGACAPTTTTNVTAQIGLRGANNSDFNNRNFASNATWNNNTAAGTVNTSSVRTRNNAYPQNGLNFIWTPLTPANLDYIEDFENVHNWTLINGTQTNKWWVGTAASNGGAKGLYVSNSTTGNNNTYSGVNNNSQISYVHAYRDIAIPIGVPKVGIYYDWRANGDTAGNDYFKVWLVSQAFSPVGGTPITAGVGRILLNDKQYGDNNWKTQYNENVDVTSFAGQNMRLLFEWTNDGTNAIQNAAAIDNVQVKKPCAGTPTEGTASIVPATGLPSSTFNVNVTGNSASSGLSYQWQVSTDGSTNWTDIPGAITANATLTAVSFSSTTRYYRRKITCMNGGAFAYTNTVVFTTTTPTYCTPTVTNPGGLYISSLAIVGTMADPPVNNSGAGTNGTGYSNYTTLSPIAQQAQGEGVNILASVGGATFGRGTWKAWVDWNGNGVFTDAGEEVYNIYGYAGSYANFGFVIPGNQDPGNYRMRIRVNNGFTFSFNDFQFHENFGFDFSPCDPFADGFLDLNGYGETEDYLINVVSNCSAKITAVTNGTECNIAGGKQVVLTATASETVTEFRWYDTLTGSTYTVSNPDGTGKATSFTTPAIATTTTYYVTAYNGSCESTFRVPVVAEIKPTPDISFTPSSLEICGETNVIAVSATGANEVVNVFPKQTFEDGTLGLFTNVKGDTNSTAVNNLSKFLNKTSVYQPSANVWFPAVSSGFGGNKFVLATSDVTVGHTIPIQNALTLTTGVNTQGLTNLTLKLRMYYGRYWPDNYNPTAAEEYVAIEVSPTGSTAYTQIAKIVTNKGQGSQFATLTYDLSAYTNRTNLKFRIVHYSYAGTDGYLPDGVGIDDVELYGERPLAPSFVWTNSNPIGVYQDAAGTIPYTSGPISTVYFKPSPTEIETYANWNVTATASLTNSCNAQGTLNIINNSKVWNSADPRTAWNVSNNWSPSVGRPTADKCVIIKKPVVIPNGLDAFGKNIKIETTSGATGNLTINGSLTVIDGIINTGTATDLIVKSDANLVQINDNATNSGDLSARRIHNLTTLRREYNYISSPVKDQNMKLVFGGVPSNIPFVTVLNEATSFFVNAKASDYLIAAKGFSVKEPITSYTGNEAEYKGVANNGVITLPLAWSASNRGYNLGGNPYPSNLDIVDLYYNSEPTPANPTKIDPTFRFWDNRVNDIYTQMGGAYQGYSYALFNAVTDTGGFGVAAPGNGTGGPAGSKIPNRVIKVSQAFMIRALGTGAQLNFKNNLRKTTNTGTVFFGKTSPYNRYHLQLVKSDGFTVQNGIAYFDAGHQDFGREDSRIPNSQASDALFSYAGTDKVVINGRSTFSTEDVISLGLRHFEMGTYKIEAADLEGVFANGQSIYLKDKQLNTLTDLTAGSYTFTSEAGEFTNRFEIVYEPGVVLAADPTTKGDIQLYRDQLDFVVQSSAKKIVNIELYDMSGRLMLSRKANDKQVRFNAETLVGGAYVLKAQLEGGEIFTKKLRK